MRLGFLIIAAAVCAWSQTPAVDRVARIEGEVVADASGIPLRRVQLILAPLDAGRPSIGTQTDDRGRFVLRDIPPGPYRLSAQRDGYLATETFKRESLRMPTQFTLYAGDKVTGVQFRLRLWAVIAGKIRFEDGDPAVGIRVDLYRQYHVRGRHGFTRVVSSATNDRGEYRVHGLAPGAYYVAVELEGDRTGPNVDDQPRLDNYGKEVPVPSYTTTFYPGSLNLRDANPVRVREGDDLTGIDMYLRPVERVSLSGRVTNGISGEVLTNAAITLERLDAGNIGTLAAQADAKFDRDGRFHIAHVAPGSYQMWVDASVENTRLLGRQSVLVTNSNVEELEVVVVPARSWSGELVFANGTAAPRRFDPRVVLEPRSERGAVITPQVQRNSFDVSLAPGETYDVFLTNLPPDLYVSQVRVLGADVRASGLSGSMVASQPFQIVVDSRGGKIAGRISGAQSGSGLDDPPWSGAHIALIPIPARERLQHYREAMADEYGRFQLSGIVPGRYILTGWRDEPPCDIYDETNLESCRATGMTVDVTANSLQEVQLKVKPLAIR